MQCLSKDEIAQFLSDELPVSRLDEIARHVEECAACGDLVQSARSDDRLFQAMRVAIDGRNSWTKPGDHSHPQQLPVISGYHVQSLIDRGGQGAVYLAEQTATKRIVAIKVLHGWQSSPKQRMRFEREIELVSRLTHNNIVTIYECGECDGQLYFAMEYVKGARLDRFVESRQPSWSIDAKLELFGSICQAVSFAHVRGVMHRDLKPANILVDDESVPHILDFGLARITTDDDDRRSFLTNTGEFIGTLAYASPEQTKGDPSLLDIRSDVYSLGVILFQVLTGEFPYEVDGSVRQILTNIETKSPHRASRLNRGIDRDVETIIHKALEKHPGRRYQSAEHLANDISNRLAGRPLDAKRDDPIYVLSKLAWKHRSAVAIGTSMFMLILIALVVSVAFWRQAVIDRRLALESEHAAEIARDNERKQRLETERQRDNAEKQAYFANVLAAGMSLDADDIQAARSRLDQAPESLRDWEWYYLLGALDTSDVTLHGHQSYVEAARFFDEGKRIASASWDKSVKIWDALTGQPTQHIDLPSHAWSIDISPDDRLLAVGAWDGFVRIWKTDDWQLIHTFEGPTTRAVSVDFSSDSQSIAASFADYSASQENNRVLFFDLMKKEIVGQIDLPAMANTIRFAGDDRSLFALGAGNLTRWNIEDGARMTRIPGNTTFAMSDDRSLIASLVDDDTVGVFDAESGERRFTLRMHTSNITCLDFSHDHQFLAVGTRGKTVHIWNIEKEAEISKGLGHFWTVTSVDFSPQGDRLLSAAWDCYSKIWELPIEANVRITHPHKKAITSIVFHEPSELMATTSRDKRVKIWNYRTRKKVKSFVAHDNGVFALSFNADGSQFATASADLTVKIWSLQQDEPLQTLRGHTEDVHALVFLPDGKRLLSGGRDNILRVWDIQSGKLLDELSGHTDHVHCLAIDAQERKIASSGHNSLKIWDADSLAEIVTFPRQTIQEDYSLAFHPRKSILAAGSEIRSLKLWDLDSNNALHTLSGHTDEILSLAFSPNGRRLVSCSNDGSVKLWDVSNGMEVATLRGYPGAVNRVAFTPDGRSVLGGTRQGAMVEWRVQEIRPSEAINNENPIQPDDE